MTSNSDLYINSYWFSSELARLDLLTLSSHRNVSNF